MSEDWEKLFRVRYNGVPVAAGRVLMAEPFLRGDVFARSVVYLTEHDEEGSLGFVVNKPLSMKAEDAVFGLDGVRFPVYLGGPVGQDSVYFIHRRSGIPGALPVKDGVYYGGNFEVVSRLVREGGLKEDEIRFFAGYSGWTKGQLERELKNDSWLVGELSPDELFGGKSEGLWRSAMERLGVKPSIWAKYPENPNMN